jgi:hypothetical protein
VFTPSVVAAQTILQGAVVDSAHKPVSLVVVTAGRDSVLTDSLGRYRVAVPRGDSAIVSFRRMGYAPREVVVALDPARTGDRILETVMLDPVPVALEPIEVVDLEPLMSRQGILDFQIARLDGSRKYFFTAYDIERLRPPALTQLVWRVPTGHVNHRGAVQFSVRGTEFCTATIVVDGRPTHIPHLDLLMPPERVGGMYFDPGACRVVVWTKPIEVREASSFSLGFRFGRGRVSPGGARSYVGGFWSAPTAWKRVDIYASLDLGVGGSEMSAQVQVGPRVQLPKATSPFYAAAGVRFRTVRAADVVDRRVAPVVLLGATYGVGPFWPLVEVGLSTDPDGVYGDVTLGIAVAF